MQMGVKFKKEQIGTLFVWVGALEGGLGGGLFLRCPPQKVDMPSKNMKNNTLISV
jgi:hypothetical protein